MIPLIAPYLLSQDPTYLDISEPAQNNETDEENNKNGDNGTVELLGQDGGDRKD